MRLAFSIALLAGVASLAAAQDPKDPEEVKPPEVRFGVAPKLKAYPQDSAKKALASSLRAVENADVPYLVAHLLDPAFVETRLAERAKQYEPEVELELARQRDFQLRNKDKFRPEDRLPLDRKQFAALVTQQSREQAFRQLVRDVQQKLLDDPQSVKDLRKILTDGTFADTETGAKATHPDVKDRALVFRKAEGRWFLENRQEELPPKKEP